MREPDGQTAAEVRAQLQWDAALNASRIAVEAIDGCVTLRGAVDTFADVERAATNAWSVRGVRSVDNELKVGLAGAIVTDSDLAAECRRALEADPLVPTGTVSARVVDGWVTLTGEVVWHFQRRAAQRAVGSIKGVLGVSNRMTLAEVHAPSDLVRQVERAIHREAIIGSALIQVSRVGSTVYLDGTVRTRAAVDAAVDTTWSTPGVTEVVNRLVVLP